MNKTGTGLILVFLFAFTAAGRAQLNSYQYVIVPKKFQAFDRENQYHTSTIIKHLFSEEGFTTYYEGEVPDDISDPCAGLKVGLLNESTMFRTKVKLSLVNCRDKEVFLTALGESRAKEYIDGYKEAIEEAFKSVKALNYSYEPAKAGQESLTISFDKDVKSLEKEVKSPDAGSGSPGQAGVQQQASPEVQRYKNQQPKPSSMQKGEVPGMASTEAFEIPSTEELYAQKIENGYQLVDRSPAIRLRLYESSVPDVYFAEEGDFHGIAYSRDDKWFLEYYKGGKKQVQELQIKF